MKIPAVVCVDGVEVMCESFIFYLFVIMLRQFAVNFNLIDLCLLTSTRFFFFLSFLCTQT